MAVRDIVALNETLPRLEVPQAGDSYNLPRDTTVAGTLTAQGSVSIGGVQRTTWPAPGNATQALTDVLANGPSGNIPAGQSFSVNSSTGVSHFAVDEATGKVTKIDLAGMMGNIMNPLVDIPFKRANDEKALSGTQTFIRASTGTYIDPLDGMVKTAAIDTPRFEKMADGGVGILLEGTSTNYVTFTKDMANPAAWVDATALGVTAVSGLPSPDGGTTAAELTLPAGNNIWRQSNSLISGTVTSSVWVRLVSGSVSSTTLDYSDGTVVTTNPITTSWQRLTGTVTAGAGVGGTGWFDIAFWGATSGTKVQVWGAQLEALPFASSYIPTTTTVVTRASDILSISMPVNSSDVTVLVDDDLIGINTGINQYLLQNTSVSTFNMLAALTNGNHWLQNGKAGMQSTLAIANQVERYGYTRAGLLNTMYINGLAVTSVTSQPATGFGGALNIGQLFGNGGSALFGHIRNFRIYDKALTASEVAAA